MAIACGTAMAVMGGISLASQLGTAVFSFFKSRKTKKQCKQFAAMNAQRRMQLQAQLQQMQGGNLMAMNGIGTNFMQPSGIGHQYGPAPQGFYPPGMA